MGSLKNYPRPTLSADEKAKKESALGPTGETLSRNHWLNRRHRRNNLWLIPSFLADTSPTTTPVKHVLRDRYYLPRPCSLIQNSQYFSEAVRTAEEIANSWGES